MGSKKIKCARAAFLALSWLAVHPKCFRLADNSARISSPLLSHNVTYSELKRDFVHVFFSVRNFCGIWNPLFKTSRGILVHYKRCNYSREVRYHIQIWIAITFRRCFKNRASSGKVSNYYPIGLTPAEHLTQALWDKAFGLPFLSEREENVRNLLICRYHYSRVSSLDTVQIEVRSHELHFSWL